MANKTVNLPSKMLMARLASCRVVLWALETHGPRVIEIFHGPLGRMLPEGLRSYIEQHVAQLREVLAAARDMLITSDRNLRDQKALTSRFRRSRNQAFQDLSPYVVGLRDTFRGACGPEVATEIGFALRTPEQPGELHEQAQHLTARLSEPDLKLPAVRFKGIALDPIGLVEEMRPLVDDLGQALENVSREERKIEAMKIAKDEALDAYNRTFLWVGQSAEALFKLAGLPAVAKRVRPSSRRQGLTDEVESQGPETESEDPDDTTAEVDAEVTAEVPEVATKGRPDIPPVESPGDSSAE